MTGNSALRSFAVTAEFVAGLMPRFARSKVITKGEAALLAGQLKRGAETALDVALEFERQENSTNLDEKELRAATAAMLSSPAWAVVFKAGSAETLARAALSAVKSIRN